MSIKMMNRNYEFVERERIAFEAVERLSKEFASAAAPVAHIGDGNCGYVISLISDALTEAGLYDPRGMAKSVSKKGPISHKIQKAVFERDKYRCRHCETHLDLTVDHILPESKGGTLDMNNLQTLCRSCNSKKGAK